MPKNRRPDDSPGSNEGNDTNSNRKGKIPKTNETITEKDNEYNDLKDYDPADILENLTDTERRKLIKRLTTKKVPPKATNNNSESEDEDNHNTSAEIENTQPTNNTTIATAINQTSQRANNHQTLNTAQPSQQTLKPTIPSQNAINTLITTDSAKQQMPKPDFRIPMNIIHYNGTGIKEFRQYRQLKREIDKCSLKREIHNAYINRNDQLIIKTTTDPLLFETSWPPDAFINGITRIIHQRKQFGVIYHVDINIDMDDEELKNELKENYKITKTTRLFKKKDNIPLTTVKLEFENEDAINNGIYNGITIGYTRFRVKPWLQENNLIQCYKCLQLGHFQGNCPKAGQKKCLRCGTEHNEHYSQCTKPLKCANCSQEHAACSKKCPNIIEFTLKNQKATDTANTRAKSNIIIPNEMSNFNYTHKQPQNDSHAQLQDQINNLNKKIEKQNIAIVTFVIDIVSNLHNVQSDIDEDSDAITRLIGKHFGTHTSTFFGSIMANVRSSFYSVDEEERYDQPHTNTINNVR